MKKILSIDGGGIRGAASATFLKLLEEEIKKPLHEVFDLFAGTSTGGLIAACLASKKFTASETCSLYEPNMAKRIMDKSLWDRIAPDIIRFRPKYDGVGKRAVIKEIFGDQNIYDIKKYLLITNYDIQNRVSKISKNTKDKTKLKDDDNPKVIDALDGTSAAPTFFPSIKTEKNFWLIDGGVAANNPSMCALAEGLKLWGKNEDIFLLSIGTGIYSKTLNGPESRKWGSLGWLKNDLVGILMDGPSSTVDYQCCQILGEEKYFRVNSILKEFDKELSEDLDDTSEENITRLKRLGEKWFANDGNKVFELIK